MTTQNVINSPRLTWTNLTTATYYGPHVTGAASAVGFSATSANAYVDMDGYDHLSIMFKITCGAVDTITLTVESDDGTTATFLWDNTLGAYESTTGVPAASYPCTNTTIYRHLHLDNCNGKRFHVKLAVQAGGPSNSGIITFRKTKM